MIKERVYFDAVSNDALMELRELDWICMRSYLSFHLVYYFTMRCLSENVSLVSPNRKPPFTSWDLILWFGIALATSVSLHTYIFWYDYGSWAGHPTVRMLEKILEAEEPSVGATSSDQR